MNQPGVVDPLYVLARRVLLDALGALRPHKDALILVGAQAIYLHTGPAGLAVAEHTTDADIALAPHLLSNDPKLAEAIQAAGFRAAGTNVGSWVTRKPLGGKDVEVLVDLLVPEAVGGSGRRGARLGVHGNKIARKVKGLEAALVDKSEKLIASLDPADSRNFRVAVAGPTALLISKLHKIADRREDQGRLSDKDALDVLRLLRTTETAAVAETWSKLISDKIAGAVSLEAVGLLERLFATPGSEGSQMAARAATPLEAAATTAASCAALTTEILSAMKT
ncbi:MAG: GSU2403 family nucleotidyltransferase fold protein [Elusimicrobiota bacterium]|nr:GSU2403 family nucleotidyltransferase fold protein [Elusimicrobiota bacterium]